MAKRSLAVTMFLELGVLALVACTEPKPPAAQPSPVASASATASQEPPSTPSASASATPSAASSTTPTTTPTIAATAASVVAPPNADCPALIDEAFPKPSKFPGKESAVKMVVRQCCDALVSQGDKKHPHHWDCCANRTEEGFKGLALVGKCSK